MTIREAVRELRARLGDTQQAFAHRMGWAISTVVRYELSREPRGKALMALRDLASDNDFDDLVAILSDELSNLLDAVAYMYQYAGATDAPVEVLDNLSALANRDKPPHRWVYPAGPK